ncbi:dihydrolipoyllysine-residue succinyltransferase [Blattabacterium cuenoti]|uniref:dihydrolipoyllysine-residue succinyltransferase n=1 Tax=Blattabacterium cuenoti TaxID=1653831 RepID=UPI00163C7FA9|nr:dihydrolipoyllysine-residue succinyltransferase [Blattabacterium cuenoti]
MKIQIKIPSPGESITEVEISSLLVNNGEYIKKGQIIAEIDSDKATLEISSDYNGIIYLMAKKGDKLKVGDLLCLIDTSYKNKKDKCEKINKEKVYVEKKMSPSSKILIKEKNISLHSIIGSGKHGLITKKDCLEYKKYKKKHYDNKNEDKNNRKTTISTLSSIRRKISERLVNVKNKTATLTTFNEVDMKEVISIRNKYKNSFKEKHGVNLGFMSFFVLSSVRALKLYPDVNATINGDNKINFHYFDINIAISGPKGLMVPVIKNANTLSFHEIEKNIQYLSNKIQSNTISIDEITGGTFTITNGGVFGSMLSTPIINPPQSAILGMHKITKRAVVINNSIEIRPIMYIALSYDHRIIDGKESVGFLYSIKESIENPIKFFMNGKKENIPNTLEI